MHGDFVSRLVRSWLLTGVIDGSFACVLTLLYGGTIAHLWQGVAATLLGPGALAGGTRTALIGVAMHFGVALAWSLLFLLALDRSAPLRRLRASRNGLLKIATAYGPCIWMVMSLAVIPVMVGRMPSLTVRWWINFFGHIPFVAAPIVLGAGRPHLPLNRLN